MRRRPGVTKGGTLLRVVVWTLVVIAAVVAALVGMFLLSLQNLRY